jgi:hypothetical protein
MTPWERARIRPAILVLLAGAGCATEGQGTTPPLPGGPAIAGDSAGVGGDDGSVGGGDEGGAAGDASPSEGGTCSDLLHGFKALLALPPVACKSSSDCAAGECCFVGPVSSTCVMQ